PVLARYGLYTYAGVQPGDRLHLDLLPQAPDPGDPVSFPIVIPTDPDPRVTDYAIYSSCGSVTMDGTPLFVAGDEAPMQANLHGCRGVADFVVIGNQNGLTPIDAFFVPDVAVAAGTSLRLSGTYAPIPGV